MESPLADQEMRSVLNRMVDAVRDLGWNVVVLVLRDHDTRTTYPAAATTTDPAVTTQLLSIPPTPFGSDAWRHDRFRMSRSYFVDHLLHAGIHILTDDSGQGIYPIDLGPRRDDEWHTGDFLVTPLIADDTELGGLLVDDPADRQRPTIMQVRALEVFADQAAITLQQTRKLVELRQQMTRQKVLNELTHTITQYLEMNELFPSITAQLAEIFSFERISIILRDDKLAKARLFVEDVRAAIPPEDAHTPSALERIAFDHIIQQGAAHLLISDVPTPAPYGDQPDQPHDQQLYRDGIRSYAILPLAMWGQVIGALNMASEIGGTFSPRDEAFLLQIAGHIGGSVWNALLHEVEQNRRHIADTLANLSKIINSTLDLDEVLRRALEQLARVIPFDTSTVLMPESDDTLRIMACWGFEQPETLVGATFRIEEDNISHRVMRAQQVRVVDDVQQLVEWGHDRDDLEAYNRIRAWIGAPLVIRDQSIGLLVLDSFEPGFFTDEDGEVVAAFASQIAIAIQNARLYEAIQKQRDRLAAILNDTTDSIIVLDNTGDIWLMNPAAWRNLKVQRDDCTGLPVSALGLPDLDQALASAQASNAAIVGDITLADGTSFRASIAPVTGVGWVLVMKDITPLKELDRLRTEWVAAVSHDLKNPIQVIQLGTAMLEIDGSLNDMQRQRVEIILRGAEQLRSLVADVLDLARLEAGPALNLATINAAEMVQAALSEIEHLAQKKRQQIVRRVPDDLPGLHGDSTLLQRAFVNLLSNAIKYTPETGTITFNAGQINGEVRFEIIDNGSGIPADSLPHLFNRFYRVPGVEGEGTGLGLSIVKSIVEKHHGVIEVSSIEGQGSTFAITLPIGDQTLSD